MAAWLIGARVETLATWRSKGIDPPYLKLGSSRTSAIRYRTQDIEEHIAAHLVETSGKPSTNPQQ